jgi:RecA-family ATPase
MGCGKCFKQDRVQMQHNELLQQLEASRQRLNLSPVEMRQLAHEIIEGAAWPVRDLSDLNCTQLQKLLDVTEALERSEMAKRLRQRELVSR